MCLAQVVWAYLVVLELEVTVLDIQRSLESLSAVVGCLDQQEVVLRVCVASDETAHDEIVQIQNWSSEDLPLKGVKTDVSSCPTVQLVHQYCLERICS